MHCRASHGPYRVTVMSRLRDPGGCAVHYGENTCSLLTVGVKRGQMHPLEGIYKVPWPIIVPLYSMVETHRATFAKYELLTHKIKSGDGRVPLGVGVGLVREACIYLLTDAPDLVWHHPSVVNTYFPHNALQSLQSPSRFTFGTLPRDPGGSTVHYGGNVCSLLTVGVKHGQLHPLEGICMLPWPT